MVKRQEKVMVKRQEKVSDWLKQKKGYSDETGKGSLMAETGKEPL